MSVQQSHPKLCSVRLKFHRLQTQRRLYSVLAKNTITRSLYQLSNENYSALFCLRMYHARTPSINVLRLLRAWWRAAGARLASALAAGHAIEYCKPAGH